VATLNRCATNLFGTNIGYASDEDAILTTVRILEARMCHATDHARAWLETIGRQLEMVSEAVITANAQDLIAPIDELRDLVAQQRSADQPDRPEAANNIIAAQWIALIERLVDDERLPPEVLRALSLDIIDSEIAHLRAMNGRAPVDDGRVDTRLTAERLRAYLADRFDDPDLRVSDFRQVGGGFGKETTFFTASGREFSGDFVVRRDYGRPPLENDCHSIELEFPVLRAAFAEGFPTPEALWLDTEHRLLPGGDFLVMRRVPGEVPGDVYGPHGSVSTELLATLAEAVARLHSLPPLRRLGDLSDSIRAEFWDLPLAEVTRGYISRYQQLYRSKVAIGSPALSALYAWLYDNLPSALGQAVLLHGDLGFHNLLCEDGALRAVLDWEFAHIGDPAEDIAYICNTGIDEAELLGYYARAGGIPIDPQRLRFFRVWGQVRNATAAAILADGFARGQVNELKMAHVGTSVFPNFIEAARRLIAERA